MNEDSSDWLQEQYTEALPVGFVQDGYAFSLWAGMPRWKRALMSPFYFFFLIGLWMHGCFLGQDYEFIPMKEETEVSSSK